MKHLKGQNSVNFKQRSLFASFSEAANAKGHRRHGGSSTRSLRGHDA